MSATLALLLEARGFHRAAHPPDRGWRCNSSECPKVTEYYENLRTVVPSATWVLATWRRPRREWHPCRRSLRRYPRPCSCEDRADSDLSGVFVDSASASSEGRRCMSFSGTSLYLTSRRCTQDCRWHPRDRAATHDERGLLRAGELIILALGRGSVCSSLDRCRHPGSSKFSAASFFFDLSCEPASLRRDFSSSIGVL